MPDLNIVVSAFLKIHESYKWIVIINLKDTLKLGIKLLNIDNFIILYKFKYVFI
jgi:hypothetical protein